MGARYKANGKPFGFSYPSCAAAVSSIYYKNLTYTPYYSGDGWTEVVNANYKVKGKLDETKAIKPGTKPQFSNAHKTKFEMIAGNYTMIISRTDTKLTIKKSDGTILKEWSATEFQDSTVPLRLLCGICGGGGSGGGCN